MRKSDSAAPSSSGGLLIAEPASKARRFERWKRLAANLLLLTIGAVIFAVGLNGVMIPKQFMSGGVMGIALISHYLLPQYNVGFIYFVLNIPLLIIGWFCVSRKFILYTACGMTAFSLATAFIFPPSLSSRTLFWRRYWGEFSAVLAWASHSAPRAQEAVWISRQSTFTRSCSSKWA